ncbi:MAG: FAD-dependent oxidoreductase, partial [Lachnospiraceae bacterium]|nr:FAD-dependent oxidoreductase [Lachnospiraceae bacterium]
MVIIRRLEDKTARAKYRELEEGTGMYLKIDQMKLQKDAVLAAKQYGTEGLKKLLQGKAAKLLRISEQDIQNLIIRRESIDARKKPEIYFIYSVEFEINAKNQRKIGNNKISWSINGVQLSVTEPTEYHFPISGEQPLQHPVVIVGMGPAGLFCGYFLAKQGYRPLILERGKCVEDRQTDVERFWETGVLDTASNVQFGEGGAGTFSDGKLNTLVKDKYGRNQAVLQAFVDCGAGEEILYEAKPHIGTDVLCKVVKNMREEIIRLGGEVRFQSQVTELLIQNKQIYGVVVNGKRVTEIPCEQVVLAVGHSARDTFQMLYEKQIPMEAKAFAVGLRVEHLQRMINADQYGT